MRKWRVCGCWVELYAYRAYFGASDAAPRRQQAQLLSRFPIRFHPSKPSDFLRSVGLLLSTPPFHHTPWSLFSWQLDRIAITATSGYVVQSTWRALMAIFTAKVPNSHSPQGCLAWAWPAHPFDSLSAAEIGPRQYGEGQGEQRRRRRYVCVHTQSWEN